MYCMCACVLSRRSIVRNYCEMPSTSVTSTRTDGLSTTCTVASASVSNQISSSITVPSTAAITSSPEVASSFIRSTIGNGINYTISATVPSDSTMFVDASSSIPMSSVAMKPASVNVNRAEIRTPLIAGLAAGGVVILLVAVVLLVMFFCCRK